MARSSDETHKYEIVAAIEIGQVFSSYAYSTIGTFQKNPLDVMQKPNWSSDNKPNLIKQTSTCILVDKSCQFQSFGFEAHDEFLALKFRKKEKDYLFFRHFCVQLYESKKPLTKLMLDDVDGLGKLSAKEVFTMSISALKNELQQQLRTSRPLLEEDDIRWVITISTLLPKDGVFFFTECAKQAGIGIDQLVVVNDAEAVLVYLHYLEPSDPNIKTMKEQKEYLMVKLAGNVTESFVVKKSPEQRVIISEEDILVKRLYNYILHDLVDNDFWKILISIFGSPFLNKVTEQKPSSLAKALRKFLEVKLIRKCDSSNLLALPFPCKIIDKMSEEHGLETATESFHISDKYSDKIKSVSDDYLSIHIDIIFSCFKSTVNAIENLLKQKENNHNHKAKDCVMIVGHLSECEVVQSQIKAWFPTKNIFVPTEASVAILKGAVMLGHDLSIIGRKNISSSTKDIDTKYFAVVAIDFGTAYSGYSYSTMDEYIEKPLNIMTKTWKTGKEYKTNTSVLLDKNRRFLEFGSKAEDAYTRMPPAKRQDVYYFENFKLHLYNNIEPLRTLKIMDIQGKKEKSVLAQELFAVSIKALKDDALQTLETRGKSTNENEIRWVLTVPAIWPDDAKMFMRESAKQAGIPSNKLLLALEPEVASLYLQYQATQQAESGGNVVAVPGTKYMVVDVGGGTTDITVHEKLQNGKVKELNKASGGDCGGKFVDAAFFDLLDRMFGKSVMKKLKEEHTKSYIQLYRSFEEMKQVNTDGDIKVKLPYQAFSKLFGSSDEFNSFVKKQNITVKDGHFCLSSSELQTLFLPTIKKIICLMKAALNFKESESVTMIMLVGGFANNEALRYEVRSSFTRQRVIVIGDAGLAVLKGAVLYGHNPEAIDPRVTRYTYGVNSSVPFLPGLHEPTRKFKDPRTGIYYCSGTFGQIIKQNSTVKLGTIVKKSYFLSPYSTEINVEFYTSDKEDPIYIDDPSCRKIGNLNIVIPIPSEEEREVDIEYIFGNTEIGVRATETKYGVKATSKLIFE